MIYWFWSKKAVFLQYFICLSGQVIFAFFIRQTLTKLIEPVDIENEFFPNGSTFSIEQRHSNEYRLKIAQNYLKNAKIENFKVKKFDLFIEVIIQNEFNKTSSSNLAIGIIASYRNNNFYLTQTLGYLIHELNHTQIPILVCFVENKTNEEIVELQKIGIDIQFLYANRSFPHLINGQSDQRIEKETFDYWDCLERVENVGNSNYVLLLEDDTLALSGLFEQLKLLMHQLTNNERRQKIDYVKLFHPWYLRKVPSYIQISLICIIICLIPVLLVRSLRSNPLYYVNALLISYLLAIYCIEENHQLIPELRYALTGSPYLSYQESCCTQAIIYRSSSIPKMLKSLRNIPTRLGFAKDHLIEGSEFLGRMTDRNFFVHFGHYSAVRQYMVEFSQN